MSKLRGFNSSEKWRHNWGLWLLVYHFHRLQSYQIKNFIVRKILFLVWGIQPAQKKAPMVQYGIPLWNETVRFFWMIAICLSTIVFVILHELSLCLPRLCSHDSLGAAIRSRKIIQVSFSAFLDSPGRLSDLMGSGGWNCEMTWYPCKFTGSM